MKWNIDNFNTFSWLISVVQIILVLNKMNIAWNWQHFHLHLFLIFERNVICSMSLWHYSYITGAAQRLNSPAPWLIDQQLVEYVQYNDKAVSVSKTRITGGFPHKGPVMWRSRVQASPNIICMSQQTHCQCSKSSGWHKKESCSPSGRDDLAIGSILSGWLMVNGLCHPDDLRCYPKSSKWYNEIWT